MTKEAAPIFKDPLHPISRLTNALMHLQTGINMLASSEHMLTVAQAMPIIQAASGAAQLLLANGQPAAAAAGRSDREKIEKKGQDLANRGFDEINKASRHLQIFYGMAPDEDDQRQAKEEAPAKEETAPGPHPDAPAPVAEPVQAS